MLEFLANNWLYFVLAAVFSGISSIMYIYDCVSSLRKRRNKTSVEDDSQENFQITLSSMAITWLKVAILAVITLVLMVLAIIGAVADLLKTYVS